jgi:hypothetical protein
MTGNNSRRRHVKTGRPVGVPRGNANALRHGMDSASTLARRKEVNAILRAARRLIREAR